MTAQTRRFLEVAVGSLFYDQDWHLYRKDEGFNATLLDRVPSKNALCFFKLSDLVYAQNSGCAREMPEDYRPRLSFSQQMAASQQKFQAKQPSKPACISCGGMGEYINGNHYKYCSNCRKRPAVRKSLSDAERGEALRLGSRRVGSGDHERQAAPIQTKRFAAHEASRDSSEGASGLAKVAEEPRISDKGLDPFAHDRQRFGGGS